MTKATASGRMAWFGKRAQAIEYFQQKCFVGWRICQFQPKVMCVWVHMPRNGKAPTEWRSLDGPHPPRSGLRRNFQSCHCSHWAHLDVGKSPCPGKLPPLRDLLGLASNPGLEGDLCKLPHLVSQSYLRKLPRLASHLALAGYPWSGKLPRSPQP